MEFNKEFKEYLKNAQNLIINKENINKLISLLNEIEETEKEDIKINFSTEEFKCFIKNIYDFTINIAESKKISTSNLKIPTNDSENNILYLKDYLLFQKNIA